MDVLKKAKASTLMETLIAMVVIVLCFSLGLLIYMNVVSSENRMQKFHANLLLKNIAAEVQKENEFIDVEIETDGLTVKQSIKKYESAENLFQLTLTAFDKKNRLIAAHREIIFIDK